MKLKGLSGGQYRPLSEKQIKTIHEASLSILEKTGFTFEAGLEHTLDMLKKAGATVDRNNARIYFPGDLVMEQTVKAPERVILFSRDGRNDLDLTKNRVHLGTGGAAIRILDLETGEARPSTLKDIYQLGRLVDKLNNIHFFLRPCIPTDIPPTAYDVNVFYTCLKATGKHVMAGVNDVEGFRDVLDLSSLVAGGIKKLQEKPFISIITSFAISPLKLDTQTTLIMQEAVRNRIPVALSCAPMAGSTSPIHHGRYPRPNPCRTTCRHHCLSVNKSWIPDIVWRYSWYGQSSDYGLPWRSCGMRYDECGNSPIVELYQGAEL